MKKPSDLSIEQIEKLNPKRIKAYRNALLDYRRHVDHSDPNEVVWVKNKISQVQKIMN